MSACGVRSVLHSPLTLQRYHVNGSSKLQLSVLSNSLADFITTTSTRQHPAPAFPSPASSPAFDKQSSLPRPYGLIEHQWLTVELLDTGWKSMRLVTIGGSMVAMVLQTSGAGPQPQARSFFVVFPFTDDIMQYHLLRYKYLL
jgi:hypothetical protein